MRAQLTVLATFALAGCGPNIQTFALSEPYPARGPAEPIVVSSVAIPECPYEELGLVTVRETFDVHGPAILEAVKDEARRLGGDAVLGLTPVHKVKGRGGDGLTGTVVRFTDPECRDVS